MSVERTTKMYVNVPVKLLAGQMFRAIRDDHSVMELEIVEDAQHKTGLYINGEWVFTEPGE